MKRSETPYMEQRCRFCGHERHYHIPVTDDQDHDTYYDCTHCSGCVAFDYIPNSAKPPDEQPSS